MPQMSKTLTTDVSYFIKYKTQPLQTTWGIVEYDAENPETDNCQAQFKFIPSRSRALIMTCP